MTETLTKIFWCGDVTITLCRGKIEVPPIEIRPKTITEYHGSLIGGLRESQKRTDEFEKGIFGLDSVMTSLSIYEGVTVASNKSSYELGRVNPCLLLTLQRNPSIRFR